MTITVSPEIVVRLLNPPAAPLPPTGVAATDGTSSANCTVTWNASTGATSYEVWRSAVLGQAGAMLASGVAVLTYADTTGVAGTTYYYGVKAVSGAGTSALSAQDPGSKASAGGGATLAAPFGLFATQNLTTDTVMLSWCAVLGATSYKVWRSTTSGSMGSQIGSTGSKTFRDAAATPGTNYYYHVVASNTDGDSVSSAQATGKCGSVTLTTYQRQVAYDSNGNIPDSWWTGLPLNTWIEVMNTNMNLLYPSLTASGYLAAGSLDGNMSGPIDAYSGAAWDKTTGRMWCGGAGHTDSRNNGFYEMDFSKFLLRVAVSPSIVTPALQSLAQQLWNATPYAWIEYDQCTDGVSATRYWPDGKAGAQHTYYDMTFVPELNEIVRASRYWWHFNIETGQERRGPAISFYSNCRSVYDSVSQKHLRYGGDGRNTDSQYDKYDPITMTYLGQFQIGLSPTTSYTWGYHLCFAELPTGKIYHHNISQNKAWQMTMGTQASTVVTLTNSVLVHSVASPHTYVDDLNLLLIAKQQPGGTVPNGFSAVDMTTFVCQDTWSVTINAGSSPTYSSAGVYGRLRYYPAKKCLVCVPSAGWNARVIRLA